jgi:hypothetical protein
MQKHPVESRRFQVLSEGLALALNSRVVSLLLALAIIHDSVKQTDYSA